MLQKGSTHREQHKLLKVQNCTYDFLIEFMIKIKKRGRNTSPE